MFRKGIAALFVPVMTVTIAGAAFADAPASGKAKSDTSEKAAKSSEPYAVMHAVSQWAIGLSQLADKKAKSDLVKGYAREVVTTSTNADAKLLRVAKKDGVDVPPLDPQTEQGKSLLDRTKAETVMLESLDGDAFDKEYMTLVTNTQQSVIHFLGATKASAKDEDFKQYLGDMTTTIQGRLKSAQDIMTKVYGNTI